jgi:hypothetical protein
LAAAPATEAAHSQDGVGLSYTPMIEVCASLRSRPAVVNAPTVPFSEANA